MASKSMGKYGKRKVYPDKIDYTDVDDANTLAHEVQYILENFGKELGVAVPEDFPAPLSKPLVGQTNDVKAAALMDYTLAVTRHVYEILRMADRVHGYKYSIKSTPSKNKALHHTQVSFVGNPAVNYYHEDYFGSLIWVVQSLRKALETRYNK
jgi:hypothetical protein